MRNNNTTNSLQMVFYSICVIHYKKTTHLYTVSIFLVKFVINLNAPKLHDPDHGNDNDITRQDRNLMRGINFNSFLSTIQPRFVKYYELRIWT